MPNIPDYYPSGELLIVLVIASYSGNLLPWSHLRTKQSYHEAGAGS